MLVIDGASAAQAAVNDNESPSSLALIYRGPVNEGSVVEVMISVEGEGGATVKR